MILFILCVIGFFYGITSNRNIRKEGHLKDWFKRKR